MLENTTIYIMQCGRNCKSDTTGNFYSGARYVMLILALNFENYMNNFHKFAGVMAIYYINYKTRFRFIIIYYLFIIITL